MLPQLCCPCLNSIHNVKRKTRLGSPLTPQTLAPINNSSFLAHAVMLFTLRINKLHGFPGDICSQQVTVGPLSEPKAGIRFLICICREMCFVAPVTGSSAEHFKAVARVTSGETGSPCGPHSTEAADDSAQDLCNYLSAHLPVRAERLE